LEERDSVEEGRVSMPIALVQTVEDSSRYRLVAYDELREKTTSRDQVEPIEANESAKKRNGTEM